MFARLKTRRNKDGSEVVYVQVVETVRPRKIDYDWWGKPRSAPDYDAPVRQRIIATIGRVEKMPAEARSHLVGELSKLLGRITATKERRRKNAESQGKPEAVRKG